MVFFLVWSIIRVAKCNLPDRTMVSPSIENMFPFLPDEELKSNMLN